MTSPKSQRKSPPSLRSKKKVDPWHEVIGEIVALLVYQPEIPHQHKLDLVEKLAKAIKYSASKKVKS